MSETQKDLLHSTLAYLRQTTFSSSQSQNILQLEDSQRVTELFQNYLENFAQAVLDLLEKKDTKPHNPQLRSNKVSVEPHRLPGVFITRNRKEGDRLLTRKHGSGIKEDADKVVVIKENGETVEYGIWNPFRSKLCAAIISGIEDTGIKPGMKVLYLGAGAGLTVSHISDIMEEGGMVYAVEGDVSVGRELKELADTRSNLIPIINDPRYPDAYRIVVPCQVDAIVCDVEGPDSSHILTVNARAFLKEKGRFLIMFDGEQASNPASHFGEEVKKLQAERFKPREMITLEPYFRDQAVVAGFFVDIQK